MYTKILVPLDGSATAEAVLPYAKALAAGFKTAIELLSVVDIGAMASHMASEKARYLDIFIATAEKNSTSYLENIAKSLSGFSIECRVVHGRPEEAILETTGKDREILIAMATHGRSGARRWLLGSVAEKVLRGTTNPLFLVRAGTKPKATSEPIINSLIVPLDGSPLAEKTLPIASSWAQALDLEVSLIRAFEFPSGAYYGSAEYLPNYDALQDDARKEAADYLKEKADALVADGVRTVSTLTLDGPAADEIITFAQGAPRAVIAMSTHGRSGVPRWILGSVTEKVVRHGDDPVLVVRGH